jgi:hypothetical protein
MFLHSIGVHGSYTTDWSLVVDYMFIILGGYTTSRLYTTNYNYTPREYGPCELQIRTSFQLE